MTALLLPVAYAGQLAVAAAAEQHGQKNGAAAAVAGTSAAANAHAAPEAATAEAQQRLMDEFRAAWAELLGSVGSVAERSAALQADSRVSVLAMQINTVVDGLAANAPGLLALQLASACASALAPQARRYLSLRMLCAMLLCYTLSLTWPCQHVECFWKGSVSAQHARG